MFSNFANIENQRFVMSLSSMDRICAFAMLRYNEDEIFSVRGHCLQTTQTNIMAVKRFLVDHNMNPYNCDIEQALSALDINNSLTYSNNKDFAKCMSRFKDGAISKISREGNEIGTPISRPESSV